MVRAWRHAARAGLRVAGLLPRVAEVAEDDRLIVAVAVALGLSTWRCAPITRVRKAPPATTVELQRLAGDPAPLRHGCGVVAVGPPLGDRHYAGLQQLQAVEVAADLLRGARADRGGTA